MAENEQDLKAELERLRAENEALKKNKPERAVTLKVSEKGALATARGPRTDGPGTNKDPDERQRKKLLLREPHVAPLTKYVEDLRVQRPDADIPWFDPTEAGVRARVLILLEAPGPRAVASGFISPDNGDPTAENMWKLLPEAGIDRGQEVVTWNVVPWHIGDGNRIRGAKVRDLDEARSTLGQLLGLLPQVRIVVLLGKRARQAWARHGLGAELKVLCAPHPSARNLRLRPDARGQILEALRKAHRMAGAKALAFLPG